MIAILLASATIGLVAGIASKVHESLQLHRQHQLEHAERMRQLDVRIARKQGRA